MARLNEPPVAPGPSAETIDVVKRRFLRQNRELAKINSHQSIRIRNLEMEGSRLLAENLSLREQVLQLQNANEARSNRPSFREIDAVKSRLEAKLLEFGGLVAELGQLQKVETEPRCRSQTATRKSPDERQWRSGLCLQEVENAMLPTITEDKYFPRRTMCADELHDMLAESDSQSPDIGPPPVSRFDREEPISFNPSPPPEEQAEGPTEDQDAALSVNLETRKKRRESGPKLDTRRVSIFEPPPEESDERPSKSVRKRKFSVQEDEEKAKSQADTFQFTRKNGPVVTENAASDPTTRSQSPERPVLASKPINTDPIVSPKKQRSSATGKPEKKPSSMAKPTRGRLTITRNVQPQLPPLQLPEPIPVDEINLESLPPKTPAVEENVFSPPSTEPSNSRAPRDTPPPGDLNAGDQTGLGARPSRRARPQVSYKEPSLNTKMRRPGKELVDAVIPANERRTSVEPTSAVKRGPDEANSAWKSLPPAPGHGADEPEVGSPLKEKLGRREGGGGIECAPEQPKLNSSAASCAISALISATSSSRRKSMNMVADTTSKAQTTMQDPADTKLFTAPQDEKDNLAIFDFADSSPNGAPQLDQPKPAKGIRRHSSVPSSSPTEETRKSDSRTSSKPDGSLPSLHSRSGSANGVHGRSTSSNSLSRSTSTSRAHSKEKKASALPSSGSLTNLKVNVVDAASTSTSAGTAGVTGNLREQRAAERAASRRKSMMT